MPAHYAHYRFGKQILPLLNARDRQCIQRFRRMFDMGLHGPDFFFYYNPFLKTAVGDLGKTFHRQSGQECFTHACSVATSEASRAYLYGLLGHYCLDSVCHPYIQQLVDIGEASHVPLESEFERYLLVLDKEPSPHTYDMSRHFTLTRGECMTVAEFYPPATGANVSQSVRFLSFAVKFLAGSRRDLRIKLLNGLKSSLCDHMIPQEENPELALYIRELEALYNSALARYPSLLEQLHTHMHTGESLGEDFAPDFG